MLIFHLCIYLNCMLSYNMFSNAEFNMRRFFVGCMYPSTLRKVFYSNGKDIQPPTEQMRK